jgi:dihydrofolate reductase
MKTQYYTATSLDGFLADKDNSLDWLLQLPEPEGGGTYPDFIRDVGALAMGSTTYEWVQQHGGPWPYTQPAWVFTTRELQPIENADLRFVRGDVRPVHAEMRAAAGEQNIWIVGGGELAGQFLDHGLLDELIITVAPVTLGGGAPLLPRRFAKPPLRLTSVQRFGETFVELRYAVPR